MGLCRYHDSDVYWIYKRLNEMEELMANEFQLALNQFFNSFMMDAIYSEETETITLEKEEVVKDA